jgi:hypothetical protein
VKTLKKKSSGLIMAEDFNSAPFSTLLRVNAIYTQGSSFITMTSGEILFDLANYSSCVVEVENDYVPLAYGDYGGIRLQRGTTKIDFIEHYTEPQSAYPWIRIVKKDNSYHGYGANVEGEWTDRGQVNFHEADTLSVMVGGNAPYALKSFNIYKSEYINIYGVLDGWRLYINDTYVATADKNELKFKSPTYPFSGNVKIYDNDVLIAEKNLSNAWGGDDYECAIDVDILNDFGEILPLAGEDFLGNLDNGHILKDYYLKNNADEPVTVTLSVAEYSPFYNWVFVSTEPINIISYENAEKDFTVSILPQEEMPFQVFIKRPSDAIEYDYKTKVCTFFLEVD